MKRGNLQRLLKLSGLMLLSLTLTSCCQVGSPKIARVPEPATRAVDIKCCLVEKDNRLTEVTEAEAVAGYSPSLRFYFMDGVSYGNLQKNVAEHNGIIRQYEQYPCVEPASTLP